MTEKELAVKCKQGDKDACRTLYEAYSQQLMGLCLRYTGDADSACDVLHDSFIKIFVAFGHYRYRGEGSLRAWMTRIVVNTALASLKNHKDECLDERIYRREADSHDFEEDMYDSVPDDVLMESICELPAGYRTVLNMYIFEDMSHSEIGRLLGINEGASRVRLTRAKSLLAEKLKEYVAEQER